MKSIDEILEKFRAPFWLYEKRWLFTSDVNSLCSTSFKQVLQTLSTNISFDNTLACHFSRVEKLELWNTHYNNQQNNLRGSIETPQKFMPDFPQLVHLECGTTYMSSELFIKLLRVAPRLVSLSLFDHDHLDEILPVNTTLQHTQIRRLKIERNIADRDIDRICQTFPNMEHLDIQVEKCETSGITKLTRHLRYLSSLIFTISNGRFIDKDDRRTNADRYSSSWQLGFISDWLQSNTNLSNYTYMLDNAKVRVWIDQ
jgi:hypothetical protein